MKWEYYNIKKDPNATAEAKAAVDAKLKDKQATFTTTYEYSAWHHARAEVAGAELLFVVDGKPVGYLKSPGIDHPTKNMLGFTIAGKNMKTASIKNPKFWHATPNPEWTKRRDEVLAGLTKNLSLNRDGLPPTDESRREREQSAVRSLGLFEADQQFTRTVEPRVGSFHDPTPGLKASLLSFGGGLLFALLDVGEVTAGVDRLADGLALISGIGTQVLGACGGAVHHYLVQSGREQLGVMPIGSGDDERQGDAASVGQQAALAAFFSPDRWDWSRRIP
jgi:hypothetical protein